MSTNNSHVIEDAARKSYTAPYTPKHPVPTVKAFRAREEEGLATSTEDGSSNETSKDEEAEKDNNNSSTNDSLYKSENRNLSSSSGQMVNGNNQGNENRPESESRASQNDAHQASMEDTSQATDGTLDARQKRKNMKHTKQDHRDREVTDPVTHLPVTVHDSSSRDLKNAPDNEPPSGSHPRTATGFSAKSKSSSQLKDESEEGQAEHAGMRNLFPPPEFDKVRDEMAKSYLLALNYGIGALFFVSVSLLFGFQLWNKYHQDGEVSTGFLAIAAGLIAICLLLERLTVMALQGWLASRINSIWDDRVWESSRTQEIKLVDSPVPESTQWLNSLLSSVWALINPELFTSLVDTLEDVMQASLPKLVRMISIEDLGQGSEAIRILGIRWLPTGAAAMNVSEDGKIDRAKEKNESGQPSTGGSTDLGQDASEDGSGSGRDEDGPRAKAEQEPSDDNTAMKGLQAEEGDFVNLEIAFSYRASSSGRSLAIKSKNAHLYLAFYLPGKIKLPVWVELRGMVGTMRMRLQLCPDPPFFTLCTLTFLGQPKVELSCVPLLKKGLNVMDLPFISSFVQSSINAALAEYVAPRSLTLDLRDMLVGEDFKKDTDAKGIIMVRIKRGREFKKGDPGFLGITDGSSDAYVAVGWAKFGKPVWSTRVIVDDMEPVWDEITFISVGTEELNAEERLRVQLWDSDRISADDDLGWIEVDLKELMQNTNSNGKQWDRSEGFQALDGDKEMPGILDWSVGFYPKTGVQPEQFQQQQILPEIKSLDDLKAKVSKEAASKLREAKTDRSSELEQQKAQDLQDNENAIIMSTPPLADYPTGVFSIQIHQITGLELEKINKSSSQEDEGAETSEGGEDLPSSYCSVILNHQTIFKTRTKPKNAKPFFNAGTEQFIRDWQTAEVIVSVRDSRVHERDPLLGIIFLPLRKIFQKRSQVVDIFPLVGGIGYGRARLSMVFRSIQAQLPQHILGWDYGTVEISSPISSAELAPDLRKLRLKIRTALARGKMRNIEANEILTKWASKDQKSIHLGVRKRHCSCVVVEFRKDMIGSDKTAAFAVLWLKDISDNENVKLKLPVWRATGSSLKRAQTNCIDDCGEQVGSIDITLKFWRGLSTCHQKLASRSPNLQEVFEVLETANDNKEIKMSLEGAENESDSSDSSSSEDGDDDTRDEKAPSKANILKEKLGLIDNASNHEQSEGDSGPIQQLKDYRDNSDQLHRRHRGLMQWKGVRTADWMKEKVEHGKNHVKDTFKHHEREPAIETEV